MKKVLTWIGIIMVAMIAITAIVGFVVNESKPTGKTGEQAEVLANKMLQAINQAQWEQTGMVQWTFADRHSFLWDKKRHLVEVTWDDKKVLLNPNEISGKAWEDGKELSGDEADKQVKDAWSYFCNDSFWLNAPAKAFDPGTERSIVKLEDGSEALMVTYTSGGVTPGDSYLWILDENGLPKSYKMWVDIIPIGGLEFTWDNWTELPSGAKIATRHENALLDIEITDLKAGHSWQEMGRRSDPFMEIAD